MAALTLVAGIGFPPAAPARAADKAVVAQVKLELRIAGLQRGGRGCDVQVKPAHPGCSFPTVTQHISAEGVAAVTVKDIEVRSADRDCAFAITIKEPGFPEKTIHRGLRLSAPGTEAEKAPRVPTLDCYISSPSKLAKIAEAKSRTRR